MHRFEELDGAMERAQVDLSAAEQEQQQG